jgi:hypothetical protein
MNEHDLADQHDEHEHAHEHAHDPGNDQDHGHGQDTPPLLPPDQMPVVRTQADLHRTWRALMGDLEFGERRLWLLFLRPDGRLLGPLLTLDDLPDGPYDLEVDEVVTVCRDILDGPGGGGSVAMLLTRPGREPWHVGDRAWARYLSAAAHRIGGKVWPVFRANDRGLAQVRSEGLGRDSA